MSPEYSEWHNIANVTLFDSGNFITIPESDSQIVKNYFKETAKAMVEESLSLPSTRDRDRNGEQEFRKTGQTAGDWGGGV